jgi:hypothetical protein
VIAPDCPFYAHSIIKVLSRSARPWLIIPTPSSNACALITDAHSPCRMEVEEDAAPDWNRCIRNPNNNGTGR